MKDMSDGADTASPKGRSSSAAATIYRTARPPGKRAANGGALTRTPSDPVGGRKRERWPPPPAEAWVTETASRCTRTAPGSARQPTPGQGFRLRGYRFEGSAGLRVVRQRAANALRTAPGKAGDKCAPRGTRPGVAWGGYHRTSIHLRGWFGYFQYVCHPSPRPGWFIRTDGCARVCARRQQAPGPRRTRRPSTAGPNAFFEEPRTVHLNDPIIRETLR